VKKGLHMGALAGRPCLQVDCARFLGHHFGPICLRWGFGRFESFERCGAASHLTDPKP
jgi:hypothetical protein